MFTKGAESSVLPYTKSGEIEKTRVHVDEFALVRDSIDIVEACLINKLCPFCNIATANYRSYKNNQ